MVSKKTVKVAGFIGALCATSALVGVAASTTGAYFTSSADGNITAQSGNLTLSTSNTSLSFSNLNPGENQTLPINYSLSTTTHGSDIWLVFDPTSAAYQQFTGGKNSPLAADGGLGGFGYFEVHGVNTNSGAVSAGFVSGNLAFANGSNTPNQDPASTNQCFTYPDGTGGSATVVSGTHNVNNNNAVPYCGVPSAIRLVTNVQNGGTGTVNVTFGLDGLKQTQQNQQEFPAGLPFKIVATQTGITPVDSSIHNP